MLAFAANDAASQLDALETFGAIPAGADRAALAAELQGELDKLAFGMTFDALGENLGDVLRVLSAHGFSLPKELVLFFKNLLYLNGFTAAVAPEADLMAQVGPVLADFTQKYGDEMLAMATA